MPLRFPHVTLASALLGCLAGTVLACIAGAAPPASDTRLLAEIRAAQGAVTAPISLSYSGIYQVEGHMSHPHEVQTYAVDITLSIKAGAVAWDSRMGPEGASRDAMSSRERGIVLPQGAFIAGTKAWQAQSQIDSAAYAHTMGAIAPAVFMTFVQEAAPDAVSADRATLRTVTGEEAIVHLEPVTRRITEIEWPRAHRRLGDVSDIIKFTDFEVRSGLPLPQTIESTTHEDGSIYRTRLKLLPRQMAIDNDALVMSSDLAPPLKQPSEVLIEEVGPGLYSFTHPDADCRCLVQELETSLMAFEAPLSSAIGEQIVDAVKKRFPSKPLKAIAFSHYHPHYTGGLRAFVAAGCDVYTTPGVEAFVREILARPFTRKPDRLQLAPRTPVIHIVSQRQEISDAVGAVTMLDIGAKSNHTDEYLVFYFPKSKVIFEGDLAYVSPGGTLRVMGRAAGFLSAVQAQSLDVATLLQAWPAHDAPPVKWDVFVQAASPAPPATPATPAPPATPQPAGGPAH